MELLKKGNLRFSDHQTIISFHAHLITLSLFLLHLFHFTLQETPKQSVFIHEILNNEKLIHVDQKKQLYTFHTHDEVICNEYSSLLDLLKLALQLLLISFYKYHKECVYLCNGLKLNRYHKSILNNICTTCDPASSAKFTLQRSHKILDQIQYMV